MKPLPLSRSISRLLPLYRYRRYPPAIPTLSNRRDIHASGRIRRSPPSPQPLQPTRPYTTTPPPLTMQPMPQDPLRIHALHKALEAGSQRKRSKAGQFSCHSTTFARENGTELTSWKLQEWDYKRKGLPTYARGLFTARNSRGDVEIVVRGYDKFFNIDEVNDTQWRNIETKTRGPYELSNKENGCIIFMSGLEDGSLLVCSKHSTGPRSDVPLSHAQAGEQWIERHVSSVGKTTRELARELRRLNVTAVGELCDDSFEEHVLAYTPETAGVYLHGINYNLPEFATVPGDQVHAFADAWGFKKAKYVVKDSLPEVKAFLEDCAQTGSWEGRDTEGFVVRCQKRDTPESPYVDWFFKYKFEEPYLMYRQWRECTKRMLARKEYKIKKHEDITRKYLQFAGRRFKEDPRLAELYKQNHGIIALRDAFLREVGKGGAAIIAEEEARGANAPAAEKVSRDVVLVTVATIGCGKTTVANALVHLFGWGHVQNDNITGQKGRPQKFAGQVLESMQSHPVVIADRNNHMKRERKQIIDDVLKIEPGTTFVALHYVHEPKRELVASIREATSKRVLDRGDNHQTIQASDKDNKTILGIMEGFLNRFQGVNPSQEPDDAFEHVINLDPRVDSRENLEKVVTELHQHFPALMKDHMPSAQDLDKAIEEATKNYEVQLKHSLDFGGANKRQKNKNGNEQAKAVAAAPPKQETPEQLVKKIEYFKITVDPQEVTTLLSTLFPPSMPADQAKTYRHLLNTRRIQPAFHVTLIHRASAKQRPDLWDHYTQTYKSALTPPPEGGERNVTPTLGRARVRLERVIWDDRLMAIMARILPADPHANPNPDTDSESAAVGVDCAPWPCANEVPHVTVGTVAPKVKPVESNALLQRYLREGTGAANGVREVLVPGVKVLEGTVEVVMRR